MAETWKPVPGYEGFYEASDLGRVRSVERRVNTARGSRLKVERILTPIKNKKTGYYCVCLAKDGEKKTTLVYVIIANTFLGNRPDGMQINHKNEDKSDNRLCNLEWMSPRDNTNYGTANKRRGDKLSIFKCKRVAQIKDGIILNVFPSTISARHITDPGHIGACALGKQPTAGGYVWRYV